MDFNTQPQIFRTVYRVSAVVLNGGTGSGSAQQPRLDPKTLWPLVTAASADTAASTAGAGAGSWCAPGPDTLSGLVTATLASAAGFLLAFLAFQQLRRLTASEERRDNTARRAQTVLEGSVHAQAALSHTQIFPFEGIEEFSDGLERTANYEAQQKWNRYLV